jgi:hypothetical protein
MHSRRTKPGAVAVADASQHHHDELATSKAQLKKTEAAIDRYVHVFETGRVAEDMSGTTRVHPQQPTSKLSDENSRPRSRRAAIRDAKPSPTPSSKTSSKNAYHQAVLGVRSQCSFLPASGGARNVRG